MNVRDQPFAQLVPGLDRPDRLEDNVTTVDDLFDYDEPSDIHYEVNLDPDVDEDPPRHEPVYVDATVREHPDRPVIPASWRGWSNIRASIKAELAYLVHALAFHAVRLPRYLLLLGFWALAGAGKLTWRSVRWVGDPDGRPAADEAVRTDSLDAWRRARENHHLHVRHRLAGLATGAAVLAVSVTLLW